MLSVETEDFDYLFKYIIIGDAYVGKSNLLLRYAYGNFNPEYQLTIGVEFAAKNLKIRDQTYRIQIWDTAGSENFLSITRSYYKSSVCALVVYDISNRDSFNHIGTWIDECKNQTAQTIFFVLVGNKSDLNDKRQVDKEEGQELADKYGIPFYEASAKTGDNVNEIFYNSADEIAKKIDQNFYNLDEDCGIKQGVKSLNKQIEKNKQNKQNNQTKQNQSNRGSSQLDSNTKPKKKKCC